MQALVYRLVERLVGEEPLSRNRHFHTFANPEGRLALRIARHLRSVADDLAAATSPPELILLPDKRMRLQVPLPAGTRTTWLNAAEWRILQGMPGMEGISALPRGP